MRVDAQRNRQLLLAAACDAFVAEEPTGFDARRRYLHDALDVGIAVMKPHPRRERATRATGTTGTTGTATGGRAMSWFPPWLH
jgi:hypothetical protein